MEWDHYSLREDFKGILHFVPKSLTAIIEKQLLPADEALHPENTPQVRDIKERCKKARH